MFSRMLAARQRRHQDPGQPADSGFVLLESIAAITVITIVMAALTTLLVTVTHAASSQRGAQSAAQIAVSALDKANALGAAAAVAKRDSTSVTTQFDTAPATPQDPAASATVAPWLTSMVQAVDDSAGIGAGATAALPTSAEQAVVNGITFYTNYYVGYCWRDVASSGDCTEPSASVCTDQYSPSVQAGCNVRVVVAVAWQGTTCPTTGCVYVSATLLNGANDPVFNFNQTPPPNPVLTKIANQTSAVNQQVSLQVSATSGVAPLTFSVTGLPPGLSFDPATNKITGAATTTASAVTVTVSVSDAFQNTDSETFTWTVTGALSLTGKVPDQTTAVGGSVSLDVTGYLTPSGGVPLYSSWSATGLPPGLQLSSAGKVTGTVGTGALAGTPFSVVVTVSDSASDTAQATAFNWNITATPPPTLTAPASLTTTVGNKVSVTAGFTCPAKGCTVSAPGLPGWVTVSGPSSTATSGTITLSGTPSSGQTGSGSTPMTIIDGNGVATQVSVSWAVTAAAGPTIGAINDQPLTYKGVKVVPTYTCATTCTFSLAATKKSGSSVLPYSFSYQLPGGWSDSSVAQFLSFDPSSGTFTVSSSLYSYGSSLGSWSYKVTITITDKSGRSASSSFTLSSS